MMKKLLKNPIRDGPRRKAKKNHNPRPQDKKIHAAVEDIDCFVNPRRREQPQDDDHWIMPGTQDPIHPPQQGIINCQN
jgi:hypothetical protein